MRALILGAALCLLALPARALDLPMGQEIGYQGVLCAKLADAKRYVATSLSKDESTAAMESVMKHTSCSYARGVEIIPKKTVFTKDNWSIVLMDTAKGKELHVRDKTFTKVYAIFTPLAHSVKDEKGA